MPGCILLLSVVSLFALDPAKTPYQYNCQNWTRQNGLPADFVTGITQTKDGYIWLGTQRGMVRFDGAEFKLFEVPLREGGSQEVKGLSRARDGGTWLSINRGTFGLYDGRQFARIDDRRWEGISTEVTAILEASDGAIWTGSDNGLGRWMKGKAKETFMDDTLKHHVQCFCEGPHGRVWIGTVERGLLFWQDGKLNRFPDESLNGANISALAETPNGEIWVGTRSELYAYDAQFRRLQIPPYFKQVNALLVDHQGVVWIGTSAAGVGRYEPNGAISWLRKENGLVSDSITSLFEDREGSLWIGTRNGLSEVTDVRFPIYSTAAEGAVVSLRTARQGGLWVTTDKALYHFDGQEMQALPGNPAYAQYWFKRVFEANNGDLYLVSNHKELLIVSGGQVVKTIPNPDWPTCMAEDAEGIIVGVGNTLCRLQNRQMAPYVYAGAAPNYFWVKNLWVARDGTLWVASNDGIFRVEKGAWRQWAATNGLCDNSVNYIFEDADGAIWAALDRGIVRIKNGELRNITTKQGLGDEAIYEIVPDNQGNFWMDCTAGILRASRQSLNACADGETNRIACDVFSGLESIKFTGHGPSEPVAGRTADGRIWFPNPEGLVMIDPARIFSNTVAPGVVIQQIRINGIEVLNRALPRLRAGEGRLQFDFAALSYIAPQKAKLRYKLEGYDSDWVDAEGRRSVQYNNLKPGQYSFIVQGCNADGVWNLAGDSFSVELPPAFYQTRPFLALCLLIGLGCLGLVYRWMLYLAESKQRRLKEANDLLELKVRERTAFFEAMVESSLDGILVVNNERKKILQNQQTIDLWQIPKPLVEGIDDAGQARHIMNMTKHPEHYLDVVNRLYANPSQTDRREIELKNGRVLDRYSSSVIGRDGHYYGRIWMFRDITARKKMELEMENTHQQLMAASRQAGMAEVATSVLHNVGNVLNSVNVSASLVMDAVRTSRAASLSKVVELLDKHQANLAEFLTQDDKGKQVSAFLAGLNKQLTSERSTMLKELDSLAGNIEHIKEIVAMQQANADRLGVTEMAQPAELMESALKMNEASYNRHHIAVVREFQDSPSILIDKHKVLQVLVNLLQNAKRACSQTANKDRRVTLRVRPQGASSIRLQVADNGVGIPVDNLTRIFAHGFTTNADGHGYGLHNGALTANQLGGTLTAQSEGLGRGATFTLELPLAPAPNGSAPGRS